MWKIVGSKKRKGGGICLIKAKRASVSPDYRLIERKARSYDEWDKGLEKVETARRPEG
jgi:hypothetical protein